MEKNRLEAFSDGVFAIAITLLILEIKLPNVEASHLFEAIKIQLPKFLAYILSFIIIGVYWVAHHQMLFFIKKVDRVSLWINIFMLMAIGFIPFPTALMGGYPFEITPSVFYGATLATVNLTLVSFWLYSHSKNLTNPDIQKRLVATIASFQAAPIFFYLIAISVSFYKIEIAYAIYVAVPLFFILPNPIIKWALAHTNDPPAQKKS